MRYTPHSPPPRGTLRTPPAPAVHCTLLPTQHIYQAWPHSPHGPPMLHSSKAALLPGCTPPMLHSSHAALLPRYTHPMLHSSHASLLLVSPLSFQHLLNPRRQRRSAKLEERPTPIHEPGASRHCAFSSPGPPTATLLSCPHSSACLRSPHHGRCGGVCVSHDGRGSVSREWQVRECHPLAGGECRWSHEDRAGNGGPLHHIKDGPNAPSDTCSPNNPGGTKVMP